ncbi:MAG TPA: peptidoglycan editing factor PgeF [Chloroflexota bacterium]|nr:peptidoglycan editing factor PgeF [Chloroflexota bacterium]
MSGVPSRLGGLVASDRAAVPFFQFPALVAAGLPHGVFTRHGGVSPPPFASLNVSFAVGDARACVIENRARLARALGGEPAHVRAARQVHGADWRVVARATTPAAEAEAPPADILLCGEPGTLLLMKFADCTPLLLWDPRRRWVALAHAGWRGTARKVAATAVAALEQVAGSRPPDLWVALGPAIGLCCYEVAPAVVAAVAATGLDPATISRAGARGRPHLDLLAANRQQLVAAGVAPARIQAAGVCTACHAELFYSHRALGTPAGRFGVIAGVAV